MSLLELELSFRQEVLEFTCTADAKMRAFWTGSLAGCLEDIYQFRTTFSPTPPKGMKTYRFSGQGTSQGYLVSRMISHTLASCVEGVYFCHLGLRVVCGYVHHYYKNLSAVVARVSSSGKGQMIPAIQGIIDVF